MKNETGQESEMRILAHELRTPLTSIMGFAELLLEDESLTGDTREYLNIIHNESIKLAEALNARLSVLEDKEESAAIDTGMKITARDLPIN